MEVTATIRPTQRFVIGSGTAWLTSCCGGSAFCGCDRHSGSITQSSSKRRWGRLLPVVFLNHLDRRTHVAGNFEPSCSVAFGIAADASIEDDLNGIITPF
jgi:hypothetical protein